MNNTTWRKKIIFMYVWAFLHDQNLHRLFFFLQRLSYFYLHKHFQYLCIMPWFPICPSKLSSPHTNILFDFVVAMNAIWFDWIFTTLVNSFLIFELYSLCIPHATIEPSFVLTHRMRFRYYIHLWRQPIVFSHNHCLRQIFL